MFYNSFISNKLDKMTTTFKGNIAAPDGFFYGSVSFDEKGILEITREDAPRDTGLADGIGHLPADGLVEEAVRDGLWHEEVDSLHYLPGGDSAKACR